MEDGVIANITGLEDLEQQLNELLPNQARTAVRRAARTAGDILVVAIEARAPVLTGFLEQHIVENSKAKDHSIVVKIGPQSSAGYFRGGQGSKQHVQFKGEAHVASVYARFEEFGTVHQPARPFMGPALEEKAEDIINVFESELQDQIDKVKK